MEEPEILKNFQLVAGLGKEQASFFLEHGRLMSFRKNGLVLQEGEPGDRIYLIRSGCLMTYFTDPDGDLHVMQFGTEMWWTADLAAFFNGTVSKYGIRAVQDSEVYIISRPDFEKVLEKHREFERYFRIIFQNALISHQGRIIRNISYTAEERYWEFQRLYPNLEPMVPLKYIASYLGITPEFLSKIRRKWASK